MFPKLHMHREMQKYLVWITEALVLWAAVWLLAAPGAQACATVPSSDSGLTTGYPYGGAAPDPYWGVPESVGMADRHRDTGKAGAYFAYSGLVPPHRGVRATSRLKQVLTESEFHGVSTLRIDGYVPFRFVQEVVLLHYVDGQWTPDDTIPWTVRRTTYHFRDLSRARSELTLVASLIDVSQEIQTTPMRVAATYLVAGRARLNSGVRYYQRARHFDLGC